MEFVEKEKKSTINKGDVVWLKSGGPEMTVHSIDDDGHCVCLWFRHGEIQRYNIENRALTKKNPFKNTVRDLVGI